MKRQQRLIPVVQILGWSIAAFGMASGSAFAAGMLIVNGTLTNNTCAYDSMSVDGASGNVLVNCTGTPPQNTPPQCSISLPASNQTIQPGGSVNFAGTATDTQDPTLNPTWSVVSSNPNNSGFTGTAPGPITFNTAGTYTVTLSATDSGGLSCSASRTITVSTSPPPPPTGCSAYPADKIVDYTTKFNTPGVSATIPAINVGDSRAYRFTFSTTNFPNGSQVGLAGNSQIGGTAGKQVVISACPGNFTTPPPGNTMAVCSATLSSDVSGIYINKFFRCALTNGTYYLNIRPTSASPAGLTITNYRY